MVAKGRIKRPAKLSGASDMLAKNHRGAPRRFVEMRMRIPVRLLAPLPHQPA